MKLLVFWVIALRTGKIWNKLRYENGVFVDD